MNDILPDEIGRWHRLEAAFRAHVELHGFSEIRTPLLEHTSLFARQIGETTDVVEKEMYAFERHGDQLTVRPEGTAGAARAFVEHSVHAREPVSRWYYLGPMFRGERPAKGRYRQFYQAGCELFGDPGPVCDAELIDLAVDFFRRIGISNVTVHVNSLGSAGVRSQYRDTLRAHFQPVRGSLSEDSQRRLDTNPLRILDSKDPRDRQAASEAPPILELLDGADRAHYESLVRSLTVLGVPFVVDPSLVRGLDYYTRTLFEVKTSAGDLGAQNTLCGGGRYDDMISDLGGPAVPAVGFAMGLERILAIMPETDEPRPPICVLAPLSGEGTDKALLLARELRSLGVRAEIDGRSGRLKSLLRRADAIGARFAILLGEAELARGVVAVKDLAGHAQDDVPLASAARSIADRLAQARAGAAEPKEGR